MACQMGNLMLARYYINYSEIDPTLRDIFI